MPINSYIKRNKEIPNKIMCHTLPRTMKKINEKIVEKITNIREELYKIDTKTIKNSSKFQDA